MLKNEKIYNERLFPKIEKHKYKSLQSDTETKTYITTPHAAKQIGNIIKKYFLKLDMKLESIVDCTACIGGDTLAFAKHFSKVYSVEIDRNRFNMLRNNVNVYELDNVELINNDCLEALRNIDKVQALYFDPPWGGSNYKNHTNLRLSINGESIEKITIDILSRRYIKKPPIFVIFKLPKNYDIQYFFKTVSYKDEIEQIINSFS